MARTSYELFRDGKTAPRKIVPQQVPPWVKVRVERNPVKGRGNFPCTEHLKFFENRPCVSWLVKLTH